MRITTRAVYDVETWTLLEWEGYDYFGLIAKSCSAGDSTATGLETSQAANANVFYQDAQESFNQNASIQAQLAARMQYMASNPMGLTPQQMSTATTNINENTATAAKQAIGSAAAYAASHGSADVGGSGIGQAVGQIGSEAALAKSGQLAQLSNVNQQLKNSNMWNAIGGLSGVGRDYGSMSGESANASTGAADASVNAGKLALASQQAGWSDVGSVVSGIGSLASGAGGLV